MFNRLFERKKEKVVKACNQCKHYKKISDTYLVYDPHKCYCPAMVSVNICYITGEEHIQPKECRSMRLSEGKCGPEGKYWERANNV